MSEAREVIAEAIRVAPTDSGGFDEWDDRTIRAVQADSILSALKEAGWVVVPSDEIKRLRQALRVIADWDDPDKSISGYAEEALDGAKFAASARLPAFPSVIRSK